MQIREKLLASDLTKGAGKETYKGYAMVETVDRDNDIFVIEEGSIQLENFLKNPVLLWAHQNRLEPIGKVVKTQIVKTSDGRNALEIEFEVQDITPLGQKVKTLLDNNLIKGLSIGFRPLEGYYISSAEDARKFAKLYPEFAKRVNLEELVKEKGDIRVYTKYEILEISIVPVPANQEALIKMVKCLGGACIPVADEKGIGFQFVDMVIKSAIPYNEVHPKGKMCVIEGAWSKRIAVLHLRNWATDPKSGKLDFEKYKKGFAWYDSSKPTNLTSYKFPHHDVDANKLCVHRRGVYTAMAFLFKPNVKQKYSLEDRKGIYDHLAMHYEKDLNKTPPSFEDKKEAKFAYLYEFDLDKAVDAYLEGDISEDELKGFLVAYLSADEDALVDFDEKALDGIIEKVCRRRRKKDEEEQEARADNENKKEIDPEEEFLNEILQELEGNN